jgi:hypothetical protein
VFLKDWIFHAKAKKVLGKLNESSHLDGVEVIAFDLRMEASVRDRKAEIGADFGRKNMLSLCT